MKKIRTLFLIAVLLFASALAAASQQRSQAGGYRLEAVGPETATAAITASDYCEFLNATATTDSQNLFDEKMESDLAGACVTRVGAPGSYRYANQAIDCRLEAVGPATAAAVTFISIEDATQYCSWKSSISHLPSSIFCISSASNVDWELKSNQIKFYLIDPSALAGSIASDDEITDLSWDSFRVVLSALLLIGTTFSEGHFSLEAARREEAMAPIVEQPVEQPLVTECYSSKSILESMKPQNTIMRLQAEQRDLVEDAITLQAKANEISASWNAIQQQNRRLLISPQSNKSKKPSYYEEQNTKAASYAEAAKNKKTAAPIYQQAIEYEQKFQEAASKTTFGQLQEAADHFAAGFGRLAGLGFYAMSPILDNSRRITAGGIIGYVAGALAGHFRAEHAFQIMSDGAIGTLLVAGPILAYNIYDTVRNWSSYCGALRVRYDAMKTSFSAASDSFRKIWTFEQELAEATSARSSFYQALLADTNRDTNLSRELHAVLLEAQAHQIMTGTDADYQNSFEQWITMGNQFYGPEIMNYAFPEESRDLLSDKSSFSDAKENILSRIRGAHVAFKEHYRKNLAGKYKSLLPTMPVSKIERLTSLSCYTKDLSDKAHNDLLQAEASHKAVAKNMMSASGALAYESIILTGKVLTLSTIGFLTGSFIGHAIPLSLSSFSFRDFYTPSVEVNSTAVAYSAYFLCVDISNSKNMIRESARRTTAAWMRLSEIGNRSNQLKMAQEKNGVAEESFVQAWDKELTAREAHATEEEDLDNTFFLPDDNASDSNRAPQDTAKLSVEQTPLEKLAAREAAVKGREDRIILNKGPSNWARSSMMPGTPQGKAPSAEAIQERLNSLKPTSPSKK